VSPLRRRKLVRDLWQARARTAAMVVAIAVSVAAVAAFLSARAILAREVSADYLAGNPASATLHVPTGVQPQDVRLATATPGVTGAVARGTLVARVRVGDGPWWPLLLSVSAPDDPQRISRVEVEQGSWPPGVGELFLERTALPFLGARVGQQVQVRTPQGGSGLLTVAGSVHDAGVAPAYQERTAYGQVTTTALARLGLPSGLTELKVTVGDPGGPSADASTITAGHPVTSIDVPPPLRHPHHGQMVTVGFVLLAFGLIALLLSSVLVATMLGGLLTAQIRQIGVMKAVGARTGQLLAMYLTLAFALAASATVLALPPGLLLGRLLARAGAGMLNLDLSSTAVPTGVVLVVLATGIAVPVAVAVPPLLRGTRRTVREAIDDHGSDPAGTVGRLAARLSRVPGVTRTGAMALHGTARRPGRFALTVGLLAVAGATFVTGLNSSLGWDALVGAGVRDRHYDLQVRLDPAVSAEKLIAAAAAVPGVTGAQAWAAAPATVHGTGPVDVAHVYPDDSHGSFTMIAPPAGTDLMTPNVVSGRWLRAGDADAVVLTTLAVAQQLPGTRVGDTVPLTVAGHLTRWHVVGIVSEFGTQGTAYVTDREFSAVTGNAGSAGLLRLTTDAGSPAARQAVLDRLLTALDGAGFPVAQAFTTDTLRTALDGHVFVLIEALVTIALLVGLVGMLGLGVAMGTSVTERTREYGIMHTLGATASVVRGLVVTEGLLTAGVAVLLAVATAVPATAVFGDFIGRNAFRQPLPFTFSPAPVLLWTVLSLLGAVAATAAAARRASRMTVREALTVQ
jgi:putative ABC transport system permease protein